MEHEATLKIVTNLDRSGIETQLTQIRQKAADRGLPAIASLLEGIAGKSRQELDALITECVKLARQSPDNRALSDQLEMVQINLPNLG
jgi:hypothetical protein